VESAPGRGSTFHFTARFGAVVLPDQEQDALAALRGTRVLIADDNATSREILSELMTGWGLHAVAVDSGSAAIAALRAGLATGFSYRLLLLDDRMPQMNGIPVAERIRADTALADTAIIMLLSTDQAATTACCRALGIGVCLAKPAKPDELQGAMLRALGSAPQPPAVSSGAEPQPQRSMEILLAEDNVVNQKLAIATLERMGHRVVLASTGKAALEHFDQAWCDVILMDVQMPEMDGYEATRRIRERERERGTRIPIIAMTAHAMAGDRERCLAAGMDDYIPKPFSRKLLEATLAKYTDRG